jgi:phytoene dehydrogenase-like protein
MNQKRKKVIIIGGGLAGLSLATELVDENFDVTLLEKHKSLGGRARNTFDAKMNDPVPIGPHVFVTAYNNFRRFLEKIDAPNAISWERKIFLEIIYKRRHYQFKHSRIPRPFYMVPWIAGYPFISWKDKLSHIPLASKVTLSSFRDLEKFDNANAYDFLTRWEVTENAINKFWRLFVLSLLNVPIELCSAAEFCLLMKHWSRLKNREFGFAKIGLGDVFAKSARDYMKKNGGSILCSTTVEKISFKKDKIDHLLVRHNDTSEKLKADVYVSTLNPVDLRELLPKEIRFSNFF